MSDELDHDPDFLDGAEVVPAPRAAAHIKARALVIEDDSVLTRICTQTLSRLGMQAQVVWSLADAVAALSRTLEPLAFVYADARVLGGGCDDAASFVRGLRPATPFVVADRSIGDVLSGDGVVICKPFDQDQFRAAFDASLFNEEIRRRLLAAAAASRHAEAEQAAALAALPSATQAALQLSA